MKLKNAGAVAEAAEGTHPEAFRANARLRLLLAYGLGAVGTVIVPASKGIFGSAPDFLFMGAVVWSIAVLVALAIQWYIERPAWPGRLRVGTIMRAFLVFFSGPFLLYACRPSKEAPLSTAAQRVEAAAFAVLPHVLLLSLFMGTILSDLDILRGAWKGRIYDAGFTFILCTWIACGLLHLFRPWPPYPRFLLIGGLPPAPKASPLGVVLFLMIFIVPLVSFCLYPAGYVLSGAFLEYEFKVGPEYEFKVGDVGALDQSDLFKCFFLLLWFTAWGVPIFAAARWMSARKTWWDSVALVLPTVVWTLCLLVLFLLVAHGLSSYIDTMGNTTRRTQAAGLLFGWLVFMAFFLTWMFMPAKPHQQP